MISKKLKLLFLLSIPVFIGHGVEEYFSVFPTTDSHVTLIFGYLYTLPTQHAVFLIFQLMLWLSLIVFFFALLGEKWRFYLLVIPGVIYFYELHHFFKAFMVGGYYPGVITAAAFPIIGIFFWKEFIRIWKKNYERN